MDEHLRFYQNFLAATNPRRSTGMEPEFTELQWKNGNMLLQSSPLKKYQGFINEVKEDQKTVLNSDTPPVVEDEIASLFPYEYLEKEFGCDFLCEPNPHAFTIDKTNKSLNLPHYQSRLSPPKTYVHDSPQQYVRPENSSNVNFCSFSRPQKIDMSNGFHKKISSELGGESSSMMTAGSSICGSNQVQNQAAGLSNTTTIVQQRNFKEDFETSMLSERLYTDTYEITGTSSSGRSGVSIRSVGPQEINNQRYKRKEREIEDFCSPSEETNYESADEKKAAQRSRRSRAAEVHNFSERKRRDRINEKMKALQDLIPHCTKSDKASMLDETIEYLKSLQQQVQIMWMGSGMATMMFPNIQNYMAQVGLGIGRSPMLQLPSSSSTNQMQMCPQSINHMRFSNQMHNSQTPESFAPLLGFHHMQPSPQGMSLYAYGAQVAQQKQMAALLKNSGMQSDGFAHDNQNGK